MADTLDVLSLADARNEVGITAGVTTWDAKLEPLITAISRRLDDVCGPIVNRTVTAELHNGGTSRIRLLYRPVSSITSVTEYRYTTSQALAAETLTTKSSNDYLLDDARVGRLFRRTGGSDSTFPCGRRNISVTYVAGRAADTAAVDNRFKEAARVCIKHLWRAENTTGSATYGAVGVEEFVPGLPAWAIPRAALELVRNELLGRGSEVLVG